MDKNYVGGMNFVKRFRLPSFGRMLAKDRERFIDTCKVIKKMQELHLEETEFLHPEENLRRLADELAENIDRGVYDKSVNFMGKNSKQLERFLKRHPGCTINIRARWLEVVSTIHVPSHVKINGNGVVLVSKNVKNIFEIADAQDIVIENVTIAENAVNGICVDNGKDISVYGCCIERLLGKPLILCGNCSYIYLHDNQFRENKEGGIYIGNESNHVRIEKNVIEWNYGTSNWMAGITLTGVRGTRATDIWEQFDEDRHFPRDTGMRYVATYPHDIIIQDNFIRNNTSSGVYLDGAYRIYITGNTVGWNDKEGICLDYGTLGAYVYGNTFRENGRRARQMERDLKLDFVAEYGRMEDGSACAKLPGVSVDNSAYNILQNNAIVGNYGGGIKMVRTALRNLYVSNLIDGNNQGQSEKFHFFGIELGYAKSDNEKDDIDFRPDYENVICRNVIEGSHYAGVYLGEGTYCNDVFDNIIMDCIMYSVESCSGYFNSVVENHTVIPMHGELLEET